MATSSIVLRRYAIELKRMPLAPAASGDPWIDAMGRGDYTMAWRISDAHLSARLASSAPFHAGPRHLQGIWTGEPLDGKRVLVRCYHGLGDTVQFIRFTGRLRQLAKQVIVWAQPQLVPLLRTAVGVDQVLPLHDGVPDVDFDCDIEIMELGHALRVDEQTIACTVPYLFPNAGKARVSKCKRELCVGLVWSSGGWDDRRSIPVSLLRLLSQVSGARLVSLQFGDAGAEAVHIPAEPVASNDIETDAATLCRLDLLISVDTFAAHLGGALGVPVWLLLPTPCDWRWMGDRADCVWYPTMRLFRQPRAGDWPTVVERVAAALCELVIAHTSTR